MNAGVFLRASSAMLIGMATLVATAAADAEPVGAPGAEANWSYNTKYHARVTNVQKTKTEGIKVVINRGADHGMKDGSKIYFLRGETGRKLSAHVYHCDSISPRECVLYTTEFSYDTVRANPYVRVIK